MIILPQKLVIFNLPEGIGSISTGLEKPDDPKGFDWTDLAVLVRNLSESSGDSSDRFTTALSRFEISIALAKEARHINSNQVRILKKKKKKINVIYKNFFF